MPNAPQKSHRPRLTKTSISPVPRATERETQATIERLTLQASDLYAVCLQNLGFTREQWHAAERLMAERNKQQPPRVVNGVRIVEKINKQTVAEALREVLIREQKEKGVGFTAQERATYERMLRDARDHVGNFVDVQKIIKRNEREREQHQQAREKRKYYPVRLSDQRSPPPRVTSARASRRAANPPEAASHKTITQLSGSAETKGWISTIAAFFGKGH